MNIERMFIYALSLLVVLSSHAQSVTTSDDANANSLLHAKAMPPSGITSDHIIATEIGHPFGWDQVSTTSKPGTFWWWLGSSVNEAEIDRQLNMLKEAGFGGVTVCPLYEISNPVLPPIEFLSDRWNEVFRYTLAKGKELGMLVDVTTGGGWPMGGPWITKDNAEREWQLKVLAVNATAENRVVLRDEAGKAPIQCVTLLDQSTGETHNEASNNSRSAKVIAPVMEDGKPAWQIPDVGKCNILVARMGYRGSDVYVGGNGAKGPVFDYWSPVAFDNMVQPIDAFLNKMGDLRPRAVYCDSFEGQGGTTPDIFEAFQKTNGYDVRPFMHEFLAETGSPENIRLWHDYRQTMASLHLEFVKRWTAWANRNGMATRYQYTGDPANPINTCGAADIPEDAPPFNTSAAHIFGKKLISAEEFTWGAGHNFKDYLDYYRKRGDDDLMLGLNHKIYHGTPFTPLSEPWPGPMYYAGGNFSETQPFFKHIRYLNEYFSRLQHILQESTPDMDVLMLWSIHDFWNRPNVGGFNWGQPFIWRNSNSAIELQEIKEKTRAELTKRGIQTDLCSDEILLERTSTKNGEIKAGVQSYKVLVIPETSMVAAGTLSKLEQLARNGATVIFIKSIPSEAAVGMPLIQDMSKSATALETMAKSRQPGKGGVYVVADLKQLLDLLKQSGLRGEGLPDKLATLRVNHGGRMTYLIRNHTQEPLDVWVPLAKFNLADPLIVVGNPRANHLALAEERENPEGGKLVHLTMAPSELLTVTEVPKDSKWKNLGKLDYRVKQNLKTIGNQWTISWTDYDGASHQIQSDILKPWTDWPELGLFSGIVKYQTSFLVDDQEIKKTLSIDVGSIHESAEIFINGKNAGCVWTTPFSLDVSKHLQQGTNTLVLEVANKAQNRIIEMNRKGVQWQKSKLEEVSDDRSTSGLLNMSKLNPVPSGLLGPVTLRGFK